jgi:hypothetical protein
MAAYVDYTYYSTTYLGTAIASTDFARLALRASAQIDQITFQRAAPIITAATDTATIALIKNATCAIAEEIQIQEASGNTDGVQSESVGGYSVSYSVGAKALMTLQERVSRAAALYLAQTGLMFGGFYTGEYGTCLDAN